MFPEAPLFPESASTLAASIDHLFFFALGGSVFFSLLIAGLIVVLGIKYRRRRAGDVGTPPGPHTRATIALEIAWSAIPLAILLFMFAWGARVYFAAARPPSNAAEYFVVGKRWMWTIQHPEGRREINELHVPLGRPIRLTMTSEDVIHSFFVPAFRIKQDVLPGRYTTLWFEANRTGTFRLFCAQYCGAEHSRMIGRIVVLQAHAFEEWLAGTKAGAAPSASGAELFAEKGCVTCHRADTAARAPILNGLFGKRVRLSDRSLVTADETYIRESILEPQTKIVAGYQPIMPTFAGQLSEDELMELIAYLKSLSGAG